MKTLIFLENDYKCPGADESIRTGQRHLDYGGIPREAIEKMEIHYQFSLKEREEIYKILFNEDHILATYSMYCQGSDRDFMFFTASAAKHSIKDLTYLDSSGVLVKFLNRNLKDEKNAIAVACGINSNNILTLVYEPKMCFKRIKIVFSEYFGDCVTLEDFDINSVL